MLVGRRTEKLAQPGRRGSSSAIDTVRRSSGRGMVSPTPTVSMQARQRQPGEAPNRASAHYYLASSVRREVRNPIYSFQNRGDVQ